MATMIELRVTCPFCGNTSVISVPEDGYNAWQAGELIQNAMPEVPAEAREVLVSGMCQECQDSIFGHDLTAEEFDTDEDGELWEEEFDEYDDCDCEEGFDPYEGCYTFDC